MAHFNVDPNVVIPEHAEIHGAANIQTSADILVLGPGPSGKYTTAHRDMQLGVRVTRGCQTGSLQQYEDLINLYPKLSDESKRIAREYVEIIRSHFEV
jgi:hypothetical protein